MHFYSAIFIVWLNKNNVKSAIMLLTKFSQILLTSSEKFPTASSLVPSEIKCYQLETFSVFVSVGERNVSDQRCESIW